MLLAVFKAWACVCVFSLFVCLFVLCLQESYFYTAAYNSHYMYLLIYFAYVQFCVHSLGTLSVHYLCILALQFLPVRFAINQFCF